ncbi:MAG: indole-3-glycerol phosphate synthase TrpC [Gemmatimonadota bacterium]|nr:indole-3-glycerol phosphate synthase TrpC [Gemmatimonadota bacterium]
MTATLDQILARTAATLPALRARRGDLERALADAPPRPAFLAELGGRHVALIAEVKRRSPSAGVISAELDPVRHASRYAAAGASAISVLTDGPFFGGSLDDLAAVAAAVDRPLLRKDFILDEAQLLEARAAGASAALLIVRALAPARLGELLRFADQVGLAALVEIHDGAELERALATPARFIGVNSRNLDTFTVDVDAAWRLIGQIPADRVAVAESGMATVEDVARAAAAGADAVLIGTALSSAADPALLARDCAQVGRRGR